MGKGERSIEKIKPSGQQLDWIQVSGMQFSDSDLSGLPSDTTIRDVAGAILCECTKEPEVKRYILEQISSLLPLRWLPSVARKALVRELYKLVRSVLCSIGQNINKLLASP